MALTLSGFYYAPKSDTIEDQEAAERANQFEVNRNTSQGFNNNFTNLKPQYAQFGWFGHPVYSKTGDYPPIMRELVDKRSQEEGRTRSRLPTFTPEEIEEIRGAYFKEIFYKRGTVNFSNLKE